MYPTQDITADILSALPQKQFYTAKMLISRKGLKLFFESNVLFGGDL